MSIFANLRNLSCSRKSLTKKNLNEENHNNNNSDGKGESDADDYYDSQKNLTRFSSQRGRSAIRNSVSMIDKKRDFDRMKNVQEIRINRSLSQRNNPNNNINNRPVEISPFPPIYDHRGNQISHSQTIDYNNDNQRPASLKNNYHQFLRIQNQTHNPRSATLDRNLNYVNDLNFDYYKSEYNLSQNIGSSINYYYAKKRTSSSLGGQRHSSTINHNQNYNINTYNSNNYRATVVSSTLSTHSSCYLSDYSLIKNNKNFESMMLDECNLINDHNVENSGKKLKRNKSVGYLFKFVKKKLFGGKNNKIPSSKYFILFKILIRRVLRECFSFFLFL
jgi:hypothetical protein